MTNEYLHPIFIKSLEKLGITEIPDFWFEEPKNPEFGDLSTNLALQLAKPLKQNPRQIAQLVISNLDLDSAIISSVDIAGAGFINIKFHPVYYTEAFSQIHKNGKNFGRTYPKQPQKINVEYVSANPTGLLHMGHARNASIGDTVANLYEWLGNEVTREYYFNNAGNQMNNLAKSIYARYMQKISDDNFPFPEDGYHGDYVQLIADEIIKLHGNSLMEGTEDNLTICRKFGEAWCFDKIKQTLKRMNIVQDIFFNEDSLYSDGKIKELIDELKSKDLAYEKDGALWLKLSALGLSEDRVIVKSTGEPTYRLPDIAYHKVKFQRGYDFLIDVFGADHIATVPDVMAGIGTLGFDASKVKVIIHQFVTLTEDGKQVKMSKRSGKSYTLDELLDEVGPDVVRFFLLMRQVTTHLEFDLSLAREHSEKNPVFYLQYAHARICSIIDNAKTKGIELNPEFNSSLLIHPKEIDLIKLLLKFPIQIKTAAEKYEPQILAEYLRDLATAFHGFYHECRIIGSETEYQNSRLNLAWLTKIVLKNGLTILGITAPERMTREEEPATL